MLLLYSLYKVIQIAREIQHYKIPQKLFLELISIINNENIN